MKLYLSREASIAHEFIAELKQQNIDVLAFSQLEIQSVVFDLEGEFEWIFFSSSNAANAFFERQSFNVSQRYAAIGNATAAAVPGACEFVGQSSNTQNVAREFHKIASGSRVLFPIGDNSLRTVQSHFNASEIQEVMVYQTTLKPAPIAPCDAYVFSSPSNVRAASQCNALADVLCFSFGKSTTQALLECGVKQLVEFDSLAPKAMAAKIVQTLNR